MPDSAGAVAIYSPVSRRDSYRRSH